MNIFIWTRQLTDQLSRLVNLYGTRAWPRIAQQLNGLSKTKITPKMCKLHWSQQIQDRTDPVAEWQPQDLSLFLKLRRIHGNSWKSVSEQMPGRTENSIKNFFYSNMKKGRTRLNKTPLLKTRPLELSFFTVADSSALKNLFVEKTLQIGFYKNQLRGQELIPQTIRLLEQLESSQSQQPASVDQLEQNFQFRRVLFDQIKSSCQISENSLMQLISSFGIMNDSERVFSPGEARVGSPGMSDVRNVKSVVFSPPCEIGSPGLLMLQNPLMRDFTK